MSVSCEKCDYNKVGTALVHASYPPNPIPSPGHLLPAYLSQLPEPLLLLPSLLSLDFFPQRSNWWEGLDLSLPLISQLVPRNELVGSMEPLGTV